MLKLINPKFCQNRFLFLTHVKSVCQQGASKGGCAVIQGSELTQAVTVIFDTGLQGHCGHQHSEANGEREGGGDHVMDCYGPGLEVAHPFLSIIYWLSSVIRLHLPIRESAGNKNSSQTPKERKKDLVNSQPVSAMLVFFHSYQNLSIVNTCCHLASVKYHARF